MVALSGDLEMGQGSFSLLWYSFMQACKNLIRGDGVGGAVLPLVLFKKIVMLLWTGSLYFCTSCPLLSPSVLVFSSFLLLQKLFHLS